ncbi:hypothetical protein EVAR_72476_1 [Eumeta japonica]|uniref:Uncharacterized protein n=1 Tax=Eumeta variegata TaxID=151549 RepID=A0A4C1SR42_EUMVA|nr:hypothetical protein EVAR_72476_1 [Eumeta japonica]
MKKICGWRLQNHYTTINKIPQSQLHLLSHPYWSHRVGFVKLSSPHIIPPFYPESGMSRCCASSRSKLAPGEAKQKKGMKGTAATRWPTAMPKKGQRGLEFYPQLGWSTLAGYRCLDGLDCHGIHFFQKKRPNRFSVELLFELYLRVKSVLGELVLGMSVLR